MSKRDFDEEDSENSPLSPLPPGQTPILGSAALKAAVYASLAAARLDADLLLAYLEALEGYRVCHDDEDLALGSHTRWFPLDGETPARAPLSAGGILCKLSDGAGGGTTALCKNPKGRGFFSFRVDCSMVYQKLTDDELLVRAAADIITR